MTVHCLGTYKVMMVVKNVDLLTCITVLRCYAMLGGIHCDVDISRYDGVRVNTSSITRYINGHQCCHGCSPHICTYLI